MLLSGTSPLMPRRTNRMIPTGGVIMPTSIIITSAMPNQKIEDFKDKKIRVNNTGSAHLLNALGAKPTPIAWGEISSALQRGPIDDIMSASCAGQQQGFGQVTKHLQNWKTGPIVGWAVLANKEEWAKIPADLQKLVKDEMWALQEEGFHSCYEYQASVEKSLKAKAPNSGSHRMRN